MIDGYDTSVEMLRVRASLYNIQYFLLHSEPGDQRDQVDAALDKLWKRWDVANEKEAR